MASKLVRKLNLPVLQAAVSASVTKGRFQSGQAIRDLNDIRSFVMGNAISVPLEAFWAPIFLAVLFALHWLYGLVALISAIIILSLSLLSDFLTRRATKRANESAIQNIGDDQRLHCATQRRSRPWACFLLLPAGGAAIQSTHRTFSTSRPAGAAPWHRSPAPADTDADRRSIDRRDPGHQPGGQRRIDGGLEHHHGPHAPALRLDGRRLAAMGSRRVPPGRTCSDLLENQAPKRETKPTPAPRAI